MTFETGTATDPVDLLTKLESFLLSVSPTPWIIDRSVSAASPTDFAFNDGDSLFVQIVTNGDTDKLIVHQSTGFDGSGVPDEPGQAVASLTDGHEVNRMTGPYDKYCFYGNFR